MKLVLSASMRIVFSFVFLFNSTVYSQNTTTAQKQADKTAADVLWEEIAEKKLNELFGELSQIKNKDEFETFLKLKVGADNSQQFLKRFRKYIDSSSSNKNYCAISKNIVKCGNDELIWKNPKEISINKKTFSFEGSPSNEEYFEFLERTVFSKKTYGLFGLFITRSEAAVPLFLIAALGLSTVGYTLYAVCASAFTKLECKDNNFSIKACGLSSGAIDQKKFTKMTEDIHFKQCIATKYTVEKFLDHVDCEDKRKVEFLSHCIKISDNKNSFSSSWTSKQKPAGGGTSGFN